MMKLRLLVTVFFLFSWSAFEVSAQQQSVFNQRVEEALKEPFIGVTANGSPRANLFKIEQTSVTTKPVIDAARALISSMGDVQREKILFPVDDLEWRNWANVHRFQRQGVSLDEMSEEQKEKAYTLLRVSLSTQGYTTSRDIMRLNHHLGELLDNFDEYGEHLYWMTIMGEPSTDEPWGWQIDGHHLIINYFVLGDQVVMTPTFMGSEPVKAESGKYQGVSILDAEQNLGLEFMQSLPETQQQTALIGEKQGRSENLTEMAKDNAVVPFEGISAQQLNEIQRNQLIELIGVFVGNLNDDHTRVKMEEVREHLNEMYFAWKGDFGDDAVFYYRIQSPVILIEFDHQGPIALSGERQIPTRKHIHTVVRTPNGNDYGKSLLQQHLERFKDDPNHGHTAAN